MKIKLNVSVSGVDGSHSAGDEIEVGNDYAYRMIESGQAELVGSTKPKKPKDVVAAEKAAKETEEEAAKAAEAEQPAEETPAE